MSVVLAIEPDSSQADPLSSVVCAKVGVELSVVTSVFAAVATMNTHVPDLVLIGRDVPEDQRLKIAAHLRSLGVPTVPTLDIPPLADPTAPERIAFLKQIDACLSGPSEPVETGSDLIAADIQLIEAEVEFRLKAELERIRAQASKEQGSGGAVSSPREPVGTLAAQVEEARREAAFAVAREREAEAVRARAEAETARAAAIEEARVAAEAEATRRTLEAEVARIKAETDEQVRAAVVRARAETEIQLRDQVARATAETEARLEAQLASVRGEAEQVRHAHQQATRETERVRAEAAAAARAEADSSLAAQTERIRLEAEARLEKEIAAFREDAERNQAVELEKLRAQGIAAQSGSQSRAFGSAVRWDLIRWDFVTVAAILLAAVGGGAVWLPRVLSSSAATPSTWAGSATKVASEAASKAASVAAAAAPTVKSALRKAETAARPRRSAVAAADDPSDTDLAPPVGGGDAVVPGFLAAFSRIPMDLYADGRRIGNTEDGQLLLPPGTYKLQLVSRRFRYQSSTIAVTIRSGQVTPYTLPIPSGQLRISTSPGAEIWVEDQRAGVAPMGPIEVPIGTHEIIVRDSAGNERRQAVEVRYGETAQYTILMPADGGQTQPATPHLAPLSQYQPRR